MVAAEVGGSRLHPVAVLREVLTVWRRNARLLWSVAALVLAPGALIELAVDASARHTTVRIGGRGFEVAGLHLLFVAALGLVAEEFLAGLAERIVVTDRLSRPRPGLITLARRLPWTRMILASLVVSTVVLVGLGLFVLPGVYLTAIYFTVGPVIVMERVGVRAALRRSRSLARHQRVPLMVLAGVGLVASTGAGSLASVAHHGPGWLTVLAEYASEVLVAPLFALSAVLAYLELRALRGEPAALESLL